jgi:hypothetical protein
VKVNQEHKKAICSALYILVMSFAAETQSAITSFTDSAAFQAAVGSVQVYNFDSFALNQGPDVFGSFQPLDQQLRGIDFDNARINFGAFGGTFRSPSNVVLNADFVNPIVINFTTPQFAVGLFNTSIVDAERFDVFDANNNLLGSLNLGAQVINFGGFTSDTAIARVSVTPIAPTNGSIYIDDLTVAAGAAVPEPASAWLLGTGLLPLLAVRKRRRTR